MKSITARWTGLILSLVMASAAALGENIPPQTARGYFEKAQTAYQKKDYAEFVSDMEMALKLRPTHQPYIYNLACGYALTGRKSDAIALLSEAARMGLAYPKAGEDSDFASLHDSKEFAEVLKQLAANEKPIVRSETAAVLPEKGLVAEGLAYDPQTRSFYLGSVYRRKILSMTSTGEAREFSHENDGLWSVMGMKVDPRRRLLWVATAGHPQMANATPNDDGQTAIFKYDLTTGKLTGKYPVPADGKKHWLGDLTLDSKGNVYASDSVSPAVYVLRSGQDKIERLCESDSFINPQGLTLTPDEQHLVMADYLKGLFLIEIKTGKVIELPAPPHVASLGIDGIYSVGNDLVCVQNGITPNRIIRVSLNQDDTRITNVEVLESNNPLFNEPTLGVVDGNEFYFNANSQWGAIDPHGQLAPPDKLKDPIILKLKL